MMQHNHDEQMRMEYDARKKALYDYNTQMEERYEEGIEIGEEKGRKQMVEAMRASGMSEEQIQHILDLRESMS